MRAFDPMMWVTGVRHRLAGILLVGASLGCTPSAGALPVWTLRQDQVETFIYYRLGTGDHVVSDSVVVPNSEGTICAAEAVRWATMPVLTMGSQWFAPTSCQDWMFGSNKPAQAMTGGIRILLRFRRPPVLQGAPPEYSERTFWSSGSIRSDVLVGSFVASSMVPIANPDDIMSVDCARWRTLLSALEAAPGEMAHRRRGSL